MSTFLDQEKARYVAEREAGEPALFSDEAGGWGFYRGLARPFCLPPEHAAENLAPAIRNAALAYFAAHNIQWHDGGGAGPSNHLCSSQVMCVNFLFPFADQPEALAEMLRPIYPRLGRMLPVEDNRYVAFEWIGKQNYLNERVARGAERTRGANSTSADAAVLFELDDGRRQMALIEWKYTETYGGGSIRISRRRTDRLDIYAPFLNLPDCPIRLPMEVERDALFVAPFDQLMRLQLLAREMERSRELGADTVTVLHVSPTRNRELQRVTSASFQQFGSSVSEVWPKLVHPSGQFLSASIEQLWAAAQAAPSMESWRDYMRLRYRWVEG